MLFRAELIAFSFLDLITKQARLNATVRAFLLVLVISSFPVILEGVGEEGQNEVNRGQLTRVGVLSINNIIRLQQCARCAWLLSREYFLVMARHY